MKIPDTGDRALDDVDFFMDTFSRINPVYAKKIIALRRDRKQLFDELASCLLGWAKPTLADDYPEKLFRGYEFFVTEVNKAQIEYEAAHKYRYSNYDEVARNTYASEEFMKLYHWGVYVSTFAWRHHLDIYRFFRDSFLRRLHGRPPAKVLDLGCGSGVWSLLTLAHMPGWSSIGVDISPTSIAWARKTAEAADFGDQFDIRQDDAVHCVLEQPCQAGISCFLLEHLEKPNLLLESMARNLEPGAPTFMTAAVTAAEIDHIYEFHRESELVKLVEDCGFAVHEMLSASQEPYPMDRRFKPRSVALIATRKVNKYW